MFQIIGKTMDSESNSTGSLFLRTFLIFSFLLVFSRCSVKERPRYTAPTLLPGTERQMKSPGFWISRHPFPDKVILNPVQIKKLNAHIEHGLKTRKVISRLDPQYSGKELVSYLEKKLNRSYKKGLYLSNRKRASLGFYQEIRKRMNLDVIPSEIRLRYGFIVRYADQRVFPTEDGLFAEPDDTDFDELQNSALDIGTPLEILHQSTDRKWYYVIAPLSSGWVQAEQVALCSLKELKPLTNYSPFAVVIRPKAGVYLDSSLTQYYDYVRMGIRLPLYKMDSKVVQVIIPLRKPDGTFVEKTAYVRKEMVHEGYLQFTARNIIQQAFELLNAPYGWGGMYGEQDCSRFIQEIFATIGIFFPRNSSDQTQVGCLIGEFDKNSTEKEKLEILSKKAIGGISVLYIKGHIMMFLGTANKKPYAIHATWAYRDPARKGNAVRKINRVAISDLFLGRGSKRGSLLKRLMMIRNISPHILCPILP
ncbi:MAG: SH3 domain-containing protein [Deltaproteobacteria bacterium]|nr:SH3 domain-containing protein [Deltaproteobacteria bacterium]MBW1908373.1 SH3 domain-containing protein [Deltaproteobacteria bacterium]MBW2032435.1 SH3 domain-containing protein [Deltaproteobacteria bacterium]MBW2168142.1 SH3 domain-containing protein [Deltaproteobacteria bacterium]